MEHPIIAENQKKRIDQPLWMLICFAMFAFWQMGFIYFVGPSLTIDGKTPLPIDMDNATSLIAVCYVLSILWMIFLPFAVVWAQRIATGVALATAVGLFLPLSDDALRLLIYVQIFCCCLMIGFETFVIVNYLSERSIIKHLTAAYAVAYLMMAVLQNEFLPITFPTFRFIMVAALAMLLIFFLRMPVGREVQPRYVKKSDGLTAPKRLLFGTGVLVFVAALMGVSGPAIFGEVRHGIFITYLIDAMASLGLYLLYRKANFHPFRVIPVLVGLGGIGFLLMYASTYVPAVSYAACALIGISLVSCQMLPLYGAVMMKSYPSRYISPVIIGLALAAVLVHGGMVEVFRAAPSMLYLVYAVVMAVLVFIYTQIEPFFLFTLRRRIADSAIVAARENTAVPETELSAEQTVAAPKLMDDPLMLLTKKEREVAELICSGYSNRDIAKILVISEHTVKDHTKRIYPKMGVHSRMELAALVGRWNASEAK
ncbi:MAG: hypothetical protein IJE29_05435 [Firmicutes bacterium]|nr:hypothetical protein [Bacillota bacterium]MBQ3199674.1 hypothetical protein [Bacillota bacterium]